MFIGNQNFLTCLFIFLTLCDSFIYLTNAPRYHTEKYLLDINLLTTLEVEDYVRNSKDGIVPIIIPIGATEQHGPTGLIGTDWITSLAVAKGVCEECNALLGPVINTGMSMHHCGFAGSLSLRPSTLVNVICDVVLSLRQSTNITHFFFINGHGGNVLSMKLALSILREKFNSFNLSHVQTTSRFFGLSKKIVSIERPVVKVNCHVDMISWYATHHAHRGLVHCKDPQDLRYYREPS